MKIPTISAGNSDGGGYGVWMRRRIGSVLDIAVKDPKTGAMTTLSARIIVQKPNQSNAYIARVQAPCCKQTITLQPRQGTQGDYRRKTHTVKKGETLEGIAKQYSTTLQILHHLNKDKIKDPNKIQVGWVLKVPPKNSGLRDANTSTNTKTQTTKNTQTNPYTKPKITTSNYQIEKGDTLGSIAQRSGKSISDLQRLNGITDPNKIQAGKYIKTGLPNTPKPAQPATKPSSQPVPSQASSTSGQSGGILDKAQEVFGDGMDWLDQKTQPIQDKFEQTIDYGSKIFNEGVDVVSQTAGKVKDDALDAVSGLFNDKPSQTQTPSQAPKPTEIKPIQTTEQNQRSQEGGTPKVVVERAKPPIIFPLMEQPLNDPGKPYANFDWRKKLGEKGASQTVFNWNRNGGRRKHAGRDLYTRAQNADASAKPGSEVVSIAPGKILDVKSFYYETDAVTISHTTEDGRKFIIRYGELDPKSVEHLKKRIGETIQQGEVLGVTGVLINNGKPVTIANNKNISMLHFEYFTGKGHSLDRADNLRNPNNIYQRRTDLADPLDILLEGYRATFIKPLPVVSNQIAGKKTFSESDAKDALIKIFQEHGKDIAVIVEKMYRAETRHFDSEQYKYCGTPGMEAHGSPPYYGWDSQLFISPPTGIWSAYENAGLSKQGGNAQVTNSKKRFVCVDSVLVGMTYLARYIKKYHGNYARWYSTDAKAQQIYRDKLSQIRARIVNKL